MRNRITVSSPADGQYKFWRNFLKVIPGDKITYAWEPWFAWYPVKTIRGKWKWMRSINQRFIGTLGFPRAGYYQYGDVFDILRE